MCTSIKSYDGWWWIFPEMFAYTYCNSSSSSIGSSTMMVCVGFFLLSEWWLLLRWSQNIYASCTERNILCVWSLIINYVLCGGGKKVHADDFWWMPVSKVRFLMFLPVHLPCCNSRKHTAMCARGNVHWNINRNRPSNGYAHTQKAVYHFEEWLLFQWMNETMNTQV